MMDSLVNKIILLIILTGFANAVYAKKRYYPELYNQPKSNIELDFYNGYILKHTYRIKPPVNQLSQAFEISYSRSMFGKQIFEKKFNYPYIGGTILATHFGNNEYFGNLIGAFPHLTFWFKRSKILDFYFRMGIGLAYFFKPYDFYTNPQNNVIGSHLNNVTQFRWGVNWKISEISNINTAFNYTHFSNGHSQNPNLGINYMALSIGYRYNFGVKKQIYLRDTVPKIGRKNYFLVGLGLGILEKGKVSNGPTFNSYNLNLQYNRATGHTNHLVAGLNLSYSDMAYKETLFKENNESNIQNRTLNSMYASVFIGDELIFNSIGVFIHVGFYVFQPYSTLNFMYQKVGVNYYFPEMGKSKWRLYSGINIKSHLNTAESLEFRSGIRF